MRYALVILLFPGSLTFVALVGAWALRKFKGWRDEDADEKRRDRLATEYMVPAWAILPEPTYQPAKKIKAPNPDGPTSNYKSVGVR